MFLSISNLDNNTFPQNLRLEMSIYTDNINSNELSFSITPFSLKNGTLNSKKI